MSMQHGEGEFRVVLTGPDGSERRQDQDWNDCGTFRFGSPESKEAAREAAIARARELEAARTVPACRYRVLCVEATVAWDADAERAEGSRQRRAAASERWPSYCTAHRLPVLWLPSPAWWYHAPARVPELRQCRAMRDARAPADPGEVPAP
jgi:hypothetical protein